MHLPEATALIIGWAAWGRAARLCAAFGMTVWGWMPDRPKPSECQNYGVRLTCTRSYTG